MGIVEELGEGVTLLQKGDRVVMPFNVADGRYVSDQYGLKRKTLLTHGQMQELRRGQDSLLHRCEPWLRWRVSFLHIILPSCI